MLPAGSWALVFEETFDGTNADLDATWDFQNGPSGHILCSRWRENVDVADGILKLQARKETRAGQDWTAASMWTRQTFRYGYFECRYQYARATGTNNSFWIMTRDLPEDAEGRFEIDINEGHYPNIINTNIHNWSGEHWTRHVQMRVGDANLAKAFHVYGLEWTAERLTWSIDGAVIRREPNTICHRAAPVWLSLAVIEWAGPVTEKIDGKTMDVDYVRVYQEG